MPAIYLDYNATCPLAPEVADAMADCLRQGLANPSSPHAAGRRARRVLEDAREGLAELLGARLDPPHADRLIFASGGTEANNLVLHGVAPDRPLITSRIEHPSITAVAEQQQRSGRDVWWAPVRVDGRVDLEAIERRLANHGAGLISLMLANHETGVIQPVEALAAWCRQAAGHAAAVHTDASQAVGKVSVDFTKLGVAAMTVAAHKFYGPVGIGALVVRGDVELAPLLLGGGQQLGARPGTESVVLAVGMHVALRICQADQTTRHQRMSQLRDRLETRLLASCPELVVHGRQTERLPHVAQIAFPGVDRQALLLALDLAGVACSAGSACSSGSTETSPTLRAMGLPTELVGSSLRFSLGAPTTAAEVDLAVDRILSVYNNLRQP